MYQNRASGYKIDIKEANIHCWGNDCNSVFFAKQQPTSSWGMKNDDTRKGSYCYILLLSTSERIASYMSNNATQGWRICQIPQNG